MSRTETTVINDLIRLIGKPKNIDASWEIPVERAGWECNVVVSISKWKGLNDDALYVAVHAHGYPKDSPYCGIASHHPFSGHAFASRLTRQWIESVLLNEIATARLTALSFTEKDLHHFTGGIFDPSQHEEEIKEHQAISAYFESSLPRRRKQGA